MPRKLVFSFFFMSTALLASFFLLILVVAARPVEFASTQSVIQTVQTAFQIHPGKDDPLRFHLDAGNVASHEVDGPADEQPTIPPLVVLTLSCVAAFLALACIASTLYIIKSLRSQMRAAWDLLPRFKHLPGGGRPLLLDAEQGSTERHPHTDDKLYFDTDSELDELDEKYQDALDVTPLAHVHDLPLVADDPPLPHTPPDPSSMRESCSSPISRPAWSVRAIDSPSLGLSARQVNDVVASETTPDRSSRRAYRSAVPDLDLALAMQLRPGLGIGADSAWMVRFLMTIFGWFAVVLTSNGSRS